MTTDAGGDPFEVLRVERGATTAEIRAAYRRLAKQLHPDVVAGRGEDPVVAQRRMAEVNRAYAILVDPDARPATPVEDTPTRTRTRERPTARRPGEDECEVCGHEPVTTERLVHQVVSGWRMRRFATERRCCRDCGVALATDALGRSLARGWWGPRAAVGNVATIRRDLAARRSFRALGPPRHVAGVAARRRAPLPPPRPLWTTATGLMLLLVLAATILVLIR